VTAGLAAASANSRLNVLRGTSYSGYANVYAQLATGDPGAAGTANASALTTRNALTWNAPAGGSMTMNALPDFTANATETIAYVTLWTASSGGTFIESWQTSASIPVISGSTVHFSAFTRSEGPVAA
jgi:hypothetical protein